MRPKLTHLLLTVAAAAAVTGGIASARIHTHAYKTSPVVVLHPKFRLIANGGSTVTSDGRYVLLSAPNTPVRTGSLIDEQTGRRTTITPPQDCSIDSHASSPLGGPWVLADCTGTSGQPGSKSFKLGYALYNIHSAAWRSFTPNLAQLYASNINCRAGQPQCSATPSQVGADWVQFTINCGDHCYLASSSFQNITTGEVRGAPSGWRPGGTTIPDLDSPSLSRKVCSPLQVPQGFSQPHVSAPTPGSLRFYGSLAISDGWTGTASNPNQQHRIYLERCGSRLHQLIDPNGWPLAANPHALTWTVNGIDRQIDGLFLPTMGRFVLRAPSTYVSALVLSSRKLYVVADQGRVWSTASPFPPAIGHH